MFESIMNINAWILGIIGYICMVMPLIYAIGGLIRTQNNCDLTTGEPRD